MQYRHVWRGNRAAMTVEQIDRKLFPGLLQPAMRSAFVRNAEIVGGSAEDVFSGRARVLTKSGADVTAAFVRGACAALALCRVHNITEAVLKAKSPSCGCGAVYDGTFSGRLVLGDGLTTALFRKNGISVQTEQG